MGLVLRVVRGPERGSGVLVVSAVRALELEGELESYLDGYQQGVQATIDFGWEAYDAGNPAFEAGYTDGQVFRYGSDADAVGDRILLGEIEVEV